MGVSAAFLLVKHDGAGLAFKPQIPFGGVNRLLELFDAHPFPWRRVEVQGEEELLRPGPRLIAWASWKADTRSSDAKPRSSWTSPCSLSRSLSKWTANWRASLRWLPLIIMAQHCSPSATISGLAHVADLLAGFDDGLLRLGADGQGAQTGNLGELVQVVRQLGFAKFAQHLRQDLFVLDRLSAGAARILQAVQQAGSD
jgi:hypothetical protein